MKFHENGRKSKDSYSLKLLSSLRARIWYIKIVKLKIFLYTSERIILFIQWMEVIITRLSMVYAKTDQIPVKNRISSSTMELQKQKLKTPQTTPSRVKFVFFLWIRNRFSVSQNLCGSCLKTNLFTGPGVMVTEAPLINFSISKVCDLTNVPSRSFGSR